MKTFQNLIILQLFGRSCALNFSFKPILLILSLSYGIFFTQYADASPFTAGDIIVTDATHVYEYTRSGSLVQSIIVPLSRQNSSERVRDSVVDEQGHLQVYNGTFSPYISSFDPISGIWQHHSMDGFSINNNGTYGKLVAYSHYVFATDGGSNGRGIVRLDTAAGTMARFAEQSYNNSPIDLTLGHDGFLYSLDGEGSPSGRFIQVFNPDSLNLIRTITLPTSFAWGDGDASRSIAVNESGFIYLNQLYGPVYKLTPDGQQVITSSTYTRSGYTDDMDLSADGQFMFTNSDGRITLLDADLHEIRSFNTTNYYASGSFGSFVPVPEPSSYVLTGFVTAFSFAVYWKRRHASGCCKKFPKNKVAESEVMIKLNPRDLL